MSLTYKRLANSEVSPELNQVAIEAAWDAARILGLYVPRVQWIKPLGTRKAAWVDEDIGNVIHISARWAKDNGPEQTRALIFHEVRHLWQTAKSRYTGYGETGRREDDANQFAYQKTGTSLNLKMWWEHDY